jgi:hypothetical protein
VLSHVIEGKIQFIANFIVNDCRQADSPRLSQRFQPRRDVHSVSVDFTILDEDVPEINPDPQYNPLLLWRSRIPLGHPQLDLDGARDRLHDTWKFDKETVARRSDDATLVLGDLGGDELIAMLAQPRESADFVLSHEAAVSDDIGGENGRKSALNPLLARHCLL